MVFHFIVRRRLKKQGVLNLKLLVLKTFLHHPSCANVMYTILYEQLIFQNNEFTRDPPALR